MVWVFFSWANHLRKQAVCCSMYLVTLDSTLDLVLQPFIVSHTIVKVPCILIAPMYHELARCDIVKVPHSTVVLNAHPLVDRSGSITLACAAVCCKWKRLLGVPGAKRGTPIIAERSSSSSGSTPGFLPYPGVALVATQHRALVG